MLNLKNWKAKTRLDRAGIKIIKLLQANNHQAFWVGGVVRNLLLNRGGEDMDIATSATPSQVEGILERANIKYKTVGKKFGTILAIVNKSPVEITTFRHEGRYSNRRHPDSVKFVKDYLIDAKRRDFTVNALYFDPLLKAISDPTGGIKDLRLKLLRFIGDPKKRIDEDALRLIRVVRLATQLQFKLEKNSFAAIKTRAKYITRISVERVRNELDKILLDRNRVAGLRLLDELGLLKFIIPELVALKTFYHKSKRYHLEGNMFNHTLLALEKIDEPDLNLAYAVIFHDIGKPKTAKRVLKNEGWVVSTKGHAQVSAEIFRSFAEKYRFSRTSKESIKWAIDNHMLMMIYAALNPEKQLEYALHPDFKLLIELWKADSEGTLRVSRKDKVSKAEVKAYRLGQIWLGLIKRKKDRINKLFSVREIMQNLKIEQGPRIGKVKEEIIKNIYLEKIKTKQDVKIFLNKVKKSLDRF
ncbi:MAG: CCA tRNA nucleotidyltransferase [Candidatus Doudnabacteria bacterium]|nr:CCA tRNA nucleotidyltransferase [Candidatus Doudnabacteria bacterium]